jgi:hypothetical protein
MDATDLMDLMPDIAVTMATMGIRSVNASREHSHAL